MSQFAADKDAELAVPNVHEDKALMHGGVPDEDTGVSIRPMENSDMSRVRALRSIVNWSADPRAFELLRGMRDPRWAVAETRDRTVIGMIGAIPLGNVGIICHLAVHAGYRRYGLGARLASWAVTYLRSRRVQVIRLYSTLQAENIYRSAGFSPTAPRYLYRLEQLDERPGVHSGVHSIDELTASDLPEVFGLDLWSCGADRSALIRATLKLHPGGGLVARDSTGRTRGYLIRSSTSDGTRIGPMVAVSPDVARLMLDRALKRAATPVEITVTTPRDAHAHRLFEEFGFVGHEDRMQMERGVMSPMYRSEGLEHYGTTLYVAT
ncbi:hypothetical protein BH23ACT11_BH23ACT11_23020 [soil metagenome]